MAVSTNKIQVLFGGTQTGNLAAGGTLTSDVVALSATAIDREIVVKTVNAAAQTAGNTVEAHWQGQGDPDQDAVVDPDGQGTLVSVLDVVDSDGVPRRTPIYVIETAGKLHLVSSAAAAVTVSAEIVERVVS
jgi:hypothetical protein